MELFLEHAPEFVDIHDVFVDGPEEDVILLDRTFTSMSFDSFYRVPSYGDWLRAADQAPAYDELRQWLQVLQWQEPARERQRWVLKSPHHLTALDTVLEVFADARVVMTHRTPLAAVPSYASMVAVMSRQYSDEIDPHEVGPYWSGRFAASLHRYDEVREVGPGRFVDVRFEDSMTDPVGQARRVVGALGLACRDDDEAAFAAYVDRDREQRDGHHRYAPEDFGLTERQLRADFATYLEVHP